MPLETYFNKDFHRRVRWPFNIKQAKMFKNALLHALQVYLTHQNVNAAQLVVLNATQIFMVQQQNIVRQTANLI